MPSSLVEAALRDALRVWRRRLLRGRGRRLGLAASLVVVVAAGAVAGRAVAGTLGPALTGTTARSAVVLGLVLPSLAAGVAVGAGLPAPSAALGERLVAAAASPLDRAAAGLIPVLPAAVAAGLATGSLVVPVVAAAPAGVLAVVPLSALALAALGVGGAVAACLRTPTSLCRGAAVPVLGCLVTAGSLRAPLSGELLRSRPAAAAATLVAVPVAMLALLGWSLIHAGVPATAVHRGARSRLPRRATPAVVVATLRLVARRRDVCVALAGATVVGLAGAAGARLVAGPAPGLAALAVVTAALAAAPVGLVLGEALRAGAHVWGLAPRRGLVVGSWLAAGALVGLAPTGVVAVACALLPGSSAGLPAAGGVGLGVWLLAVLAGGLAARGGEEGSSRPAALALFALLAGGLSALLSVVGPRLEGLGLPGPFVAAGVLGSLAVITARALAAAAAGGR